MSLVLMLLLALLCAPRALATSAQIGPQAADNTEGALNQAAAGFEALGQKLHQALHGLALDEVAISRRLHEAESLNVLSPLKQKAAFFVIALTEFRTSSGSMGSSTILVLVLILGIPLAIVGCAAIYFLSGMSHEGAQSPNPRAKMMYIPEHRTSQGSPMTTPEKSDRLLTSRGSHSMASSYSVGTSHSSASPPNSFGGLAQFKRADADVLCPALVVEQGGGVTLKINGAVLPHKQEVVADVISMDHAHAVVCRMFLSEAGRDSGILIESATRFPLAFINTANAVNQKGLKPPKNRQVSISGSSPLLGAEPATTFAVALPQESGGVIVRRGSRDGPMMYTVNPGAEGSRVTDANGRQVAVLKTSYGSDMIVWVGAGGDACMMLCSVVAAAKLM